MSHWLWAELDSVSVDPAIGISTSDGFFFVTCSFDEVSGFPHVVGFLLEPISKMRIGR